MTDDQRTDDQVTDDQVTDDQMTDDQVTDDQVTDDQVTDDQVTDDRVTDDRVLHDEDAMVIGDEGVDERVGAGRQAESGATGARLLDGGDDWAGRWNEIQIRFVDEPQRSIEDADALVDEVIRQLTARFADERQHLERQWSAGSEPSTEDLRVALQRYRSFFDRLLAA
jgi:hypothetical protein